MSSSATVMKKTTVRISQSLDMAVPDTLQQRTVTAVLLALGSNYQADDYLPKVRQRLALLGHLTLSTAFENPDFTATAAQPKPDYTNQCALLSLTEPMPLAQIQAVCKAIENECNRCRADHHVGLEGTNTDDDPTGIRRVTMDIDILLICMLPRHGIVEKQPAASAAWIVMANRYPFKAHEQAGIDELDFLSRT